MNARRILNRPRLVWTRRHPARAADASEEASGSWFARARVRGRGRVLSRVRIARLTSWSRRTRARPSRRGARRAPTWRRARASSRSWTREGALVATGKCGPARRPSARARAARARRSPPRPPRDADPREARGCARWEGRPRAPRRVRRARASSGARQRPTRGVIFAREAPSARSARGPARETDAPRRIDIDRDRVSPVGVAGAAGEPDAKHPRPRAHFRARRRPPVFPASGLASPRLAEHPRSVARARPGPLPRLPPLARGFAIVASVRVSSVPTSKGLESTR